MNSLRLLSLGGHGSVTQNMYVYEYENEILIVDCGIGFPDSYMPGVDVLIPDIRYLLQALEKGKQIVGMVFSHGHDDHIAAAPYLLPHLPDFPLYGSPLTARFAEARLKDGGHEKQVTSIPDSRAFQVGTHFSIRLLNVTHSVPDTRHVVITTPAGTIYHGSDFKLDKNPVDGVATDLAGIEAVGKEGVLCMLVDSLRVERDDFTPSESAVGPALEQVLNETKGKYVVTLMSSHIHRIQQVITACKKQGRKVAFVGRSVEQNVAMAVELGKLEIPVGMQVDKRDINNYRDNELCIIVAGSQGQEGSSLMRAVFGEHPVLQIKPNDTVIFSADAIPGNEINFYGAIDELTRNRVHVVYPAVRPDIHSSGHASMPEQRQLVELVKPQMLLPVGGADRHRYLFAEKVAAPLGYHDQTVLLPETGQVLEIDQNGARVVDVLTLQAQIVDGLGVGDVGPVVLSDRRTLGQSGIVVVVVPRTKKEYLLREIAVVSRGFIFMREAEEVVEFIKQTVAGIIDSNEGSKKDEELRRTIEKRLSRKLYKIIQREPMIVPVLLDV